MPAQSCPNVDLSQVRVMTILQVCVMVILLPGQVSTCSPGTAAAGAGGPVEDPPRALIRDSDTQVAGFKLARLGLSDSGNTALS